MNTTEQISQIAPPRPPRILDRLIKAIAAALAVMGTVVLALVIELVPDGWGRLGMIALAVVAVVVGLSAPSFGRER